MNRYKKTSINKKLLLFVTIGCCVSLRSFAGMYFNHLTVNNGLSQNSITSIIQDSKGLIWIGSYDGLNRFDGFSTVIKRHDPENTNSLSENRILCMTETEGGKIWIGTEGGGLNVYNPNNDNFLNYTQGKGNLLDDNILCISPDLSGNLWIGTDKGLTLITEEKDGTVNFRHLTVQGSVLRLCADKKGNIWFASNSGLFFISAGSFQAIPVETFRSAYIYALFCDSMNNVWVSTFNALTRITESRGEWQPTDLYPVIFPEENAIVRTIAEDHDGNLWMGTEKSGLFKLLLNKDGTIAETQSYHTEIPFCNISDKSIRVLFVDRTNVLWIGFHKKGVNYADIDNKKFNLLTELCEPVMTELGYKSKYISFILCDSNNKVWLVSEEEGLFVYDPEIKKICFINSHPDFESICSVTESHSGDFWMGANNRILKLRKKDSDAKHYPLKSMFYGNNIGIIRTLCEDMYGALWFGSITGEGLYRYDPSNENLNIYRVNDHIASQKIFYLLPDKKEPVVWVGTLDGGLIRVEYEKNTGKIETKTYTTTGELQLRSNHIWHIYDDDSNHLWVGTDAGLNKITLDAGRNITKIESINIPLLNGIKVMAITEDLNHNLWLNCSQGLYCYNPRSETVKVYTYEDGLQSNTFTEAASISKQGRIFAGGINGVNYFFPGEIKDNPYESRIAIVDFRIHGKTVKPGQKTGQKIILNEDINTIKEIVLDYKNNNFMFEFVAIHYAIAGKNRFQYQLAGFDNNWIWTDSKLRIASYSNLPAGKYTFMIKSSNNDGVWSEPVKKINITILPPPWKTMWAYIFYVLCLLGLIYFIIYYLLTKQNLNHELQIERIEKEKMNEMYEMKMSFFTNITHEFRTPLALILSPLKDLIDNSKKQSRYEQLRLQIINRNAIRLLNLINQTLDMRKISFGNMSLLVTPNNLKLQVENMIESFGFWVKDRNIEVPFENKLTNDIQWYDKYKIDNVLLNILSNAFKFTPRNGNVNIRLEEKTENGTKYAVVSVKDSGKGIPASDINKIFEPFYQVYHTSGGTGIGLSYARSLLEIHGGKISVASLKNEGACFTFQFPVDKEAYDANLINETIDVDSFSQPVIPYPEEESDDRTEEPAIDRKEKKKKILIVEDNIDLRMYIKDCLMKHYEVLESSNGSTGLAIARKENPDLIITDIMMPGMNGIEFCKAVKADIYTKHIPIFIHSVKFDEITMKEAMNAGAEDFIGKPFNYNMLIKKINNFFKTREHLIVRIQAEKIMEQGEIEIPSSEDELMHKVSIIIENNLSNSDFNIDLLSKSIGLSRMQLHRKIISITGKQTSDVIRDIRLQRAAQLLKTGEKRISEVMWETGFNNYTRFNKYFIEKYGINPKEYFIAQK
jgi:signal transduction histidine kinase/ligand-binding sensor domain-containing protein/DNA-binding response OmpR family regulator